MANQMWMGIPTEHMQWIPCPLIDSTITRRRYSERVQFQNGGGTVSRSNQYQMEYNLNISGLAHDFEGVDSLNRFASGYYGDGYIYLAYPTAFETNLFSANWASPGLIEEGWKNNVYPSTTPTFANTSANSYKQPLRTPTWNITSTPNTPVSKFTIPIPPTHTLHIGASGTSTGTAVVQILPVLANNSYTTAQNLTLLNPTGSTRFNETFSGGTYCAIDVYITRTSTSVSTISLTSMIAQLYKSSVTPTYTTSHIYGEGSSGLKFADDAIVETYSYMYPPRKAVSTTLIEVEAWQ